MDQRAILATSVVGPAATRLAAEIRRRRHDAGLSHAQVAAMIGYSRQYVSLAERPRKNLPSNALVVALDQALDAGGTLLALRHEAMIERRGRRAMPVAVPDSGSIALPSRVSETDDMNRRALLRLVSMTGPLLAAVDLLDWDRIDHAAAAGQLDAAAVEQYTALNAHLWRVFTLSTSKKAVFPLVRDQLDVLAVALRHPNASLVRQRLCMLAGDLFQLVGEVLFDQDRYTDAAHCYAQAASASKEAGDYDLWACAITRHAFLGLYERRFDQATPLLDTAAALARRGDSGLSTRHWVAVAQAHVHAGVGDLDACQRALDTAEQVRGLTGPIHNGGWLRFDGSRLAEERGACYVELGRLDLAESALTEAIGHTRTARRRGSVLIDLAQLSARRHDVDHMIDYTRQALDTAKQTGSGVLGHKLEHLQRGFAPFLGNGRVRSLNEGIAALTGANA